MRFSLLAGGRHEDPKFGYTADEIRESGFHWVPGLGISEPSDSPAAVGQAIAKGTRLLAEHFEGDCPDLLVLMGDRYEMLCGANASLGFSMPLAHIHGGAVTEGAIDELVRHALTKMSHLHFVSCDLYGRRLVQMGEEPWRVHVTGAPGLDAIENAPMLSSTEVSDAIGMDAGLPTLLVCYHPVTAEPGATEAGIASLMQALENIDHQIVITYPNADLGHEIIIEKISEFAKQHRHRVCLSKNLGNPLFISLLSKTAAIIGNSSSGIVEAPSFRVPTVNIGTRQEGKVRAASIIDTGYGEDEIEAGIALALRPEFKEKLRDMKNPYGDGKAAPRIVEILERIELDATLLRKKFCDFHGAVQ